MPYPLSHLPNFPHLFFLTFTFLLIGEWVFKLHNVIVVTSAPSCGRCRFGLLFLWWEIGLSGEPTWRTRSEAASSHPSADPQQWKNRVHPGLLGPCKLRVASCRRQALLPASGLGVGGWVDEVSCNYCLSYHYCSGNDKPTPEFQSWHPILG